MRRARTSLVAWAMRSPVLCSVKKLAERVSKWANNLLRRKYSTLRAEPLMKMRHIKRPTAMATAMATIAGVTQKIRRPNLAHVDQVGDFPQQTEIEANNVYND